MHPHPSDYQSDPPIYPPASPDVPAPGQPPAESPLPGRDAPPVEIPPGDDPMPTPPANPM